ncbi:MAG: DUF721 domain-containing protein [Bdellovibrionales bacterium]|nr:DUF721 domain-containing protein [Bdellovibrionales bacterium]
MGNKKTKRLSSLASVIEDVFSKKSSRFSEIFFLLQLQRSWKKLAGEEISKKANPVHFKYKTLFLKLPDSSSVQEMHFVKETLKNKINQEFPEYKIEKILLKT